MLDWLKKHPLWRAFSELDTLASLVQCLKIGAGVVNGLMAAFGGWLDRQPGSIQFVLFLPACLMTIGVINSVLWMHQWRASRKAREPSNDNRKKTQVRDEMVAAEDGLPVAEPFEPYYDLSSVIFQMDFSGLWARTDPHIELIIYAKSLSKDHQVTLTGVDGRLQVGEEACSLPPRLVNGPCELIERRRTYSCIIRQPLMPAMAEELTKGSSLMNLSTKDGRAHIFFSTIKWVGTVQKTGGRVGLLNRLVSEEAVALVRGPIMESDAEKVLWRVEPQFVSQLHYYLHDGSLRSERT